MSQVDTCQIGNGSGVNDLLEPVPKRHQWLSRRRFVDELIDQVGSQLGLDGRWIGMTRSGGFVDPSIRALFAVPAGKGDSRDISPHSRIGATFDFTAVSVERLTPIV